MLRSKNSLRTDDSRPDARTPTDNRLANVNSIFDETKTDDDHVPVSVIYSGDGAHLLP